MSCCCYSLLLVISDVIRIRVSFSSLAVVEARRFMASMLRSAAASRAVRVKAVRAGSLDLLHFRSGFLRAMLAIEETGYGTQT